GTAKFDLTMSVTRRGGRLVARLEYSLDLFTAETAGRIGERFRTVLAAAVAEPSTAVAALPVLTDGERHQVLVDWNATGGEPARDALVHELVAAQAARTPGAVAVVSADGSHELTYRELDERAERLAGVLRGRGVGPDVPGGAAVVHGRGLGHLGGAQRRCARPAGGPAAGDGGDVGRRRSGGPGRRPDRRRPGRRGQPRVRHLHLRLHRAAQGRDA